METLQENDDKVTAVKAELTALQAKFEAKSDTIKTIENSVQDALKKSTANLSTAYTKIEELTLQLKEVKQKVPAEENSGYLLKLVEDSTPQRILVCLFYFAVFFFWYTIYM